MARILVIDDEPDILLTLRLTLEGAKHEVIEAREPEAALALAEGVQPDAITLDVMMPSVSGWDLLKELRTQPATEAIPILMLTALGEVPHRVRGLRGGADDYLVKPFDPEELLARIEGLITRRQRRSRDRSPGDAEDGSPSLEAAIAELDRRIRRKEKLGKIFLGRYRVQELIASGAMGMVFRGRDPKLRRPVALKTFRLDAVHIERQVQVSRLLEEAVAAARCNHPNIVTVYDVGDEGTAAYIAMEWVEGVSLEQYLKRHGQLAPELVIPLGAAIARGLSTAHAQGLLHRDVKPGNVLLGSNRSIKVTDFGVAEFVSRATQCQDIFGTPGYLAPECLQGEGSSTRSDLFSLGVVLYECFTGKHPFLDPNWAKTLQKTVTYDPEPLRQLNPEVPERAEEMVAGMLEKDPEKRPSDAAAVAEGFEQLAAEGNLRWTLGPSPQRDVGPRSEGSGTRWIPPTVAGEGDSAA